MSKELDVEEISRICDIIGRNVHRRFPQTPAADLSQEVWVWVAEHTDEILEWASEVSGGLSETTGSTPRLYLRGYRVATAYARRERAAATGYAPHDEYFYSIGVLRRVLPLYFEEKGSLIPDDLVVPDRDIVLDLEQGLLALRGESRAVLHAMFSGDRPEAAAYESIGEYWGITRESAEKKVARALSSLRKTMGGPDPYSDGKGRKAISNAQARFITSHQEEG